MTDILREESHIYVFYKGERVPWIVPGLKNGDVLKLDPATFTPDMLPKGRIKDGDVTMVPIPKVPGRISVRKDGHVEVILYKYYDRDAHQSRNHKVIIGSTSRYLPGLMDINDNFYKYFDGRGNFLPPEDLPEAADPAPDEETPTEPDEETETEPADQTDKAKPSRPAAPTSKTEEDKAKEEEIRSMLEEREALLESKESILRQRKKDLDAREKELNARELNLRAREQQLLQAMEDLKFIREDKTEHIEILNYILDNYEDMIKIQARKKPDQPMTRQQVRIINEILSELKAFFTGSDMEDYLHLAEEPDPEARVTGTTNGEMSLLLSLYRQTIHAFIYKHLKAKYKV